MKHPEASYPPCLRGDHHCHDEADSVVGGRSGGGPREKENKLLRTSQLMPQAGLEGRVHAH